MQPNEVEAFLADWIGLDAASLGTTAVERACRVRREALGISDPHDLARRVRDDEDERDRLVEEVVVSESWFFRDPQVFDSIAKFALTLAAMPGRSPVRILSVPCAGGEEPYSIAMALLDAGLPEAAFRIDAFDVSRVSLAKAAAGRYSENAFRNADSSFRRRWFRAEPGGSLIDDRVKRAVSFRWGNLLEPGFATAKGPYDCIFCRNLLIYLTADARHRVAHAVESMLASDGLLVLGAAEPPILRGGWIPAGDASLFTVRRSIAVGRPRVPSKPRLSAARPIPSRATHRSRPGRRPEGAAARKPADGHDPARPTQHAATDVGTGGAASATGSSPLERTLELAGRLANERRLSEAIDLCDAHARSFGPSPEIFFMAGMLHQSAGDLDRAEACFHKTLYLDPAHEEAALALALVASHRGDARMAEKYRESAVRVFARKGSS